MGGKGHHPSSSESDDWGDGSWIVDCPCGVKDDDGEEMVECDECGVWVHTACCRVPKGLSTYGCDKCKIKKKLKESEESEVAQLLAELPGKTVSFEERSNEKTEVYAGHPNSSVEERAHVHGVPGGDPSFFLGVSRVFCRELWKYTGYVPKYLKIDDKELPEPREDVFEFLRDLPAYEVPMSIDDRSKCSSIAPDNGHAVLTIPDIDKPRDKELLKEDCKEAVKDKEGKNNQVKRGEGKHSKHRHKPKVKEEKPQYHGKRARDEDRQKEQSSKKKAKNDHCKLEEGQCKMVDACSPHEVGLLGKSPSSSPKNPKAMKKLAVQEFMDGDMILCSRCSKVEPLLVRTLLITGCDAHLTSAVLKSDIISSVLVFQSSCLRSTVGADDGIGLRESGRFTEGRSDLLCEECERLGGETSPVTTQLGIGSLKPEPSTLAAPTLVNSRPGHEVRLVSRRELDYCEAGSKTVRFRDLENHTSTDSDWPANSSTSENKRVCNNSSADKKSEVDLEDVLESSELHENIKVLDDKDRSSVKLESPDLTMNRLDTDIEVGQISKGLVLPVKCATAFKARCDSPMDEDLLMQMSGCANDGEARPAGDSVVEVLANKQVGISMPGTFVENLESSSKLAQIPHDRFPAVSIVPDNEPVIAEVADVNAVASFQGKITSAGVADKMADKATKLPASSFSAEAKGQGSARTAGHLPASVRGKMLGERSNQQPRRTVSTSAGPQQAPVSGPPLVQLSSSGIQRLGLTPVSTSIKGGCTEDSALVKQHGHSQLESISPTPQVMKRSQQARLLPPATDKPATGISDTSPPSCAAQHVELDQPLRSKGQPGEHCHNDGLTLVISPRHPQVLCPDKQDTRPLSPVQAAPAQVVCQQARQLNGVGHVYSCRPKPVTNNCASVNPTGPTSSLQGLNVAMTNTKVPGSLLKSPSSGTSSSSPTSPLVSTPSSKSPLVTTKVPGSPPAQRSVSGTAMPKASSAIPHSSSKFPSSTTISSSKHIGTLHMSKSVPSLPASPLSMKGGSMSKQASRSNSLPSTKTADVSCSLSKAASVAPSRGVNHSGDSAGASGKDNMKNVTFSNNKSLSSGKTVAQLAVAKPPSSSKSSHLHASGKGALGTSVSKQHAGPGSGTLKASVSAVTKSTTGHHGKVGMSSKEEKSNIASGQPVLKPVSTMPPLPPQGSVKRPPSTGLTSSIATTLKDEELALLLHQELNSSPRVPRIPRVRQAAASLQSVSSPFLSSAKGSFVSATSGGSSHRDHHPAPRKRTREDRHKDPFKSATQPAEDVGKMGAKPTEENKSEDGEGGSLDKGGNFAHGNASKEKSSGSAVLSTMECHTRQHCFAKGNLSIILPGDSPDGDKRSPADNSVVTLPGLIDEVLSTRGHQLSYEDVCEAVLPHWPKLRKPNGERYAYVSHRQAVLDCLRNRSAWAHLVDRGPKTNLGRKRRRNDSTVSDTDEEEENHLSNRGTGELGASKPSKRSQELDMEKREGITLDIENSSEAVTLDDVPKGKRKARRRRRVAIEDGTDGEEEPTTVVEECSAQARANETDAGVTSPEEEPEAVSSPSSEEAVSNYSEDDEEMVVHRGMRNRRHRTGDESNESEDDMD